MSRNMVTEIVLEIYETVRKPIEEKGRNEFFCAEIENSMLFVV